MKTSKERNLSKRQRKILKTLFLLKLINKRIPNVFRPRIWRFLIKNELKINKSLFTILLEKSKDAYNPSSLIKKDMDRTFTQFHKSEEFSLICKEALLILTMFSLHRPDLNYVQGMSYIAVMLLIFFPPYPAFKLFCNLVLGNSLLFNLFNFNKKYIEKITSLMEDMAKNCFPLLYQNLSKNNIEIWKILWVDLIYAIFMKNFDL